MPTQPLDSVLARDISKVAAKGVIDLASPLLQELVNHGTCALVRCIALTHAKEDEHFPCYAIYRHIIEATDGIEVLISQCCGAAATPLLRTSFEARLSLAYILEDQSHYDDRSDAWFVGYIRQRLAFYELTNPDTSKGKEFHNVLKASSSSANPPPNTAEMAQKGFLNLKELLAKPRYQAIDAEYNRQKRCKWYSLCAGPGNLRELSIRLKQLPAYEILYRQWSQHAHSESFANFLGPPRSGQSTLRGLQEPKDVALPAWLASSFMLTATSLMIKKFRPDENLGPWLKTEVRPRYDALQAVLPRTMSREQ